MQAVCTLRTLRAAAQVEVAAMRNMHTDAERNASAERLQRYYLGAQRWVSVLQAMETHDRIQRQLAQQPTL